MLGAFRDGEKVPDVFLADRRHLPYLVAHHLIQPVDGLLDDRGFDLGDEFPHSSLTAFGSENHLQCVPYGVQPEVVYYNKSLVHLDQVKSDPATPGQGWALNQFAAAARWATRHHPGVAGIALDPTLTGISPFIYSGGGDFFDSTSNPTSLAFSSSSTLVSLRRTVEALRAPGTMLTHAQLARHSPLEWFMRGKLALLEGTRQMVPDLRSTPGLKFDVMPMPSISTSDTSGSLTGMCLSQHATDVSTAADFLVYASSPGALALVSYGGYLQPANQTVALSDAFQQPQQQPKHASVFTFSVKSMVYPPAISQWDDLDLAVDPLIQKMLEGRPSQVARTAHRIDGASYRILGPRYGPTPDPTQSGG
jgi:multiple sugar transport system substrate-binding protein